MPDREIELHIDADIDAALRRAPDVRVPVNFQNRLMARLPEPVSPLARSPRTQSWTLPVILFLAALGLAMVAAEAIEYRAFDWLQNPVVLASVVVTESALSLLWLWRTFAARR